MTPKRILIVAGEPSGDLHASNLVKDLKTLKSDLQFFGLGGRALREAGVDISFDIADLALVGLVEVLRKIFTVGKVYKDLLARIAKEKPDLAILVDYPGFNLRLARELKTRGVAVVYYISPQVWAWGRERIGVIKQCVRKILVFFRFEEELYKTYGVDVEFVGHPLLDNVKVTSSKENTKKRYGLSDENLTVAILPGSRQMEVTTLLPVMLSACKIIKWALGKVQFIVSRYEGLSKELYDEIINESRLDAKVASGDTYNVLAASDFAIVASGTATLETAMIATPFVIVYKTNLLTYLAAQIVMRNKFLGLVNIIADKEVVPEFLQFRAAPAKIAMESINIISDVDRKAAMVDAFRSVTSSLGEPGASMRAAASILPLLQ